MYKITICIIFGVINVKVLAVNPGANECASGWTPYLDQKCYIALESTGTEGEAEAKCSQLNPTATLVTIHTAQEEEWLTNYLKGFAHISEVVWIGLKWSGSQGFVWVDNTGLDYKSWGKDALLDGSLKCADFSLSPYTLGNWTDMVCTKKALIACQSPQMSLLKLSKELYNVKTELQAEIDSLKKQVVPIGFLYTQLPNMSAPAVLWPTMKWDDVTAQYAGLFFRAEGGTAATFGEIQQANYSRITKSRSIGLTGVNYTGNFDYGNMEWDYEGWTTVFNAYALSVLQLLTTSGDNRPRNTAIKLWKRSG